MKQILKAGVIMAVLTTLFSGCGQKKVTPVSDTKDGVTVELRGVTYEKKGIYVVIPDIQITNESGSDLTAVHYKTSFFDQSGNSLGEIGMFWRADERVLANGEVLEKIAGRYMCPFEGKADSVTIEITEIRTAEAYPLDRIPQPGEYVYQAMGDEKLAAIKEHPPVKIECGIDQGGYLRTATFQDEQLAEAVEAFTQITLGEDGAPMVTDNYNYFAFFWEDGTSSRVSLNLDALEYSANGKYHSYYLNNSEPFWNMIYANLKEPGESADDNGASSSLNHVKAELMDITYGEYADGTISAAAEVTITNTDDDTLSGALVQVVFSPEEGEPRTALLGGTTKPLNSNESETIEIEGTLEGFKRQAETASVQLVETAFEGAPGVSGSPVEGKFLYQAYGEELTSLFETEMPVYIEIEVYEDGSTKSASLIKDDAEAAAEAFKKIRIGPESELYPKSRYISVTILFEDGEEYNIGMNRKAAEFYIDGNRYLAGMQDYEEFFEVMEQHLY